MRILHVMEATHAGTARHLTDLAGGQAAKGHDVAVLWGRRRSDQAFIDRLYAIPGINAQDIDMHRSIGLHDVTNLRLIRRFIQRHGPFDVMHGHSSKGGAMVRLLPSKPGRIKVYTPNAFRTLDPQLPLTGKIAFGLMEAILAMRSDRVIAVSSQELEHAKSTLHINPRKLALVANGADLAQRGSRAEARKIMGLRDDEIAVGFIGRLSPQKDPARFAAAVRHGHRQNPALRGIVIGDGDLRAASEAAAGDAPIRFLGWNDGPALIKGFDICCLTSLYEGFPYTLLEAVHAGVPIVTTEIGGAREAIRDGETGRILPLNASAETIGDALADAANDPNRLRAWGAANIAMAADFSVPTMVERTMAVYQAALAEKVPG